MRFSFRHIHHRLRGLQLARDEQGDGRLARFHRPRAGDRHDEESASPLGGGGDGAVHVLLQDPPPLDQEALPEAWCSNQSGQMSRKRVKETLTLSYIVKV